MKLEKTDLHIALQAYRNWAIPQASSKEESAAILLQGTIRAFFILE